MLSSSRRYLFFEIYSGNIWMLCEYVNTSGCVARGEDE